ncbi:MAG: hypothetical protein COB35_04305 [Gammaproteobacteria bacterium]|nr:MAG: hypothetical protein COB35_04305 [Gammaproteobacteria bacterium]
MPTTEIGALRKMITALDDSGTVQYQLPLGDFLLPLNDLIGSSITLNFNGVINCQHCGKRTKKSYSQGFCFPCMQKLAQCDMCILKPETCHYEQGTCREPQWGEQHCFTSHFVYLANTSGVKVGITRHTQLPTRWIDQGATQALPIFKVNTRLQSGLVEIALTEFINDKTNWRTMLKENAQDIDLKKIAAELIPQIESSLENIKLKYGAEAITALQEQITHISYPVTKFLTKINSFNLDKNPILSGLLLGIKGQYLIFEHGVINIRKFTSYNVSVDYN